MPTTLTVEQFMDRARGMLLLAAYGDAFGAVREADGLKGEAGDPDDLKRLPNASLFYGGEGMAWNVWAPSELVSGRVGVVTDDTEYRHLVLEPYLRDCLRRGEGYSTAGWLGWLKSLAVSPSSDAWLGLQRSQHASDWLAMHAGHREEQSAVFYQPNRPTCFGLFEHAHLGVLASLSDNLTGHETVAFFSQINPLDHGHAKLVTGLWACFVSKAVRIQSDDVTALINRCAADISGAYARQHPSIQQASDLAQTCYTRTTGNRDSEFVESFSETVYQAELPYLNPKPADRNFDPLYMWMQLVACSARARSMSHMLTLLAALPGDTDTVASLAGLIAGAATGYKKLMEDQDEGFVDDLRSVEAYCSEVFGIDFAASATLLYEVAQADVLRLRDRSAT